MDGWGETLAPHPPMDGWGWGGGSLLLVLTDMVVLDAGDGLQHVDAKGCGCDGGAPWRACRPSFPTKSYYHYMPNEMEHPVYPETKALWWFSMTFHLYDWEKEELCMIAEKFVCALLRKAVWCDLHIHMHTWRSHLLWKAGRDDATSLFF